MNKVRRLWQGIFSQKHDKRRRIRYDRHDGSKKIERCRDYEEMGFCKKGELCPYDHGSDPIVVTDMAYLEQLKRNPEGDKRDSYGPETPLFQGHFPVPSVGVNIPGFVPMVNNMPVTVSQMYNPQNPDDTIIQVGGKGLYRPKDEQRDKRDITRDTKERDKYRGRPNPFQHTLVISNITPDLNNIDKLNSHFKHFGTIINIQVKPHINKAFVQFNTHDEAEKALNSPDAVLGNRFIKVNWSKKIRTSTRNKRP